MDFQLDSCKYALKIKITYKEYQNNQVKYQNLSWKIYEKLQGNSHSDGSDWTVLIFPQCGQVF